MMKNLFEFIFIKQLQRSRMPTQKQNFQLSSPSKQSKSNEYIGHYEEAPSFMKDNEDITHGYRINFNNPKKIFKSLFMLHNQSVNIWTHLCPAILILLIISYFSFFSMGLVQNQGSYEPLKGCQNSFSNSLNNFTLLARMRELTDTTTHEMEQVHKSLVNSYSELSNQMLKWREEMEEKMNNYKEGMKKSFQQKISEFDELKKKYETVFIPYILNKINYQIDSTYLQELKTKLDKIKTSIDSDTYNFIEVGHEKTPNPHEVSRWPIVVFLGSALTCLMCSALFHLFYPMSGRAFRVFSRLDYAGISILISGSCFPPLYYGLYCNVELAIFYLTIICVAGGSIFVILLFDWVHEVQHKNMKALLFGGFGISTSIPLLHILLNQLMFENYGDSFDFSKSLPYYILLGASYLFGLYIYTIRCPQRNRPGRFNVCGHSHQIWHCFVVLGIIFTYIGVLQNFEMRKGCQCP